MYRLALVLGFALLFTGLGVRLALGGLDASVVVAVLMAAVFWWQVRRQWRLLRHRFARGRSAAG
jgi:hypothetical protein